MLTATAEMGPFPTGDTPLFPLNGCPARSCPYIFFLSIPGVCNSHGPVNGFAFLLLSIANICVWNICTLFSYYDCSCWLFYHFWCPSTRASLNYVTVSLLLCTEQLFSAVGYFWTGSPQSSFCCPFNFFLPPTTALELPPSILCFIAIFSSCHFSTWNPLLLSIQPF